MLSVGKHVCMRSDLRLNAGHPVGKDWSNSDISVFTRSSHPLPSCCFRNITECVNSRDGPYLYDQCIFVVRTFQIVLCCSNISCDLEGKMWKCFPRSTSNTENLFTALKKEREKKVNTGLFICITTDSATNLYWVFWSSAFHSSQCNACCL